MLSVPPVKVKQTDVNRKEMGLLQKTAPNKEEKQEAGKLEKSPGLNVCGIINV